jgi:DNA-binding MurR/RpiR family transcriptional regulator
MLESQLGEILFPNGLHLSKQQLRVAEYLAANAESASYASARYLASEISVDSSTIIRYAQALGYRGFRELQEVIREVYLHLRSVQIEVRGKDGYRGLLPVVVAREMANLTTLRERMDPAVLEQVARAIAEARRTVIVARGSHGALGIVLEQLGQFLGYDVSFENRGGWHSGALVSNLTKEDLLIAITFWWGDRETIELAQWAAGNNIPVVAITDQRYAPFAQAAKYLLNPPIRGGGFFTSLVPPLVVVYSILEMLAEMDPVRSHAAISRAENLYDELSIRVSHAPHRVDRRAGEVSTVKSEGPEDEGHC